MIIEFPSITLIIGSEAHHLFGYAWCHVKSAGPKRKMAEIFRKCFFLHSKHAQKHVKIVNPLDAMHKRQLKIEFHTFLKLSVIFGKLNEIGAH